jgi:hypothetical protein
MQEELKNAKVLLREGDPQGAFKELSGVLRYPGTLGSKRDFTKAMTLVSEAAQMLGAADFSQALRGAGKKPNDLKALFDAGYALYEQGLPGISATVLARAHGIDPKSVDIALELSVSLEDLALNADALKVLRATGAAEDVPYVAYLIGFNALMTGDVEEARGRAKQLVTSDDPNIVGVGSSLDSMVVRADAIGGKLSLKGNALTAWHAVLNGSLLLHESSAGYDDPMHGRYAFVVDSPALMKEGVLGVADVLKRADRRPARVVAAPDRGSQILGTAAAEALELPMEPWTAELSPDSLVVVWSVSALEDPSILGAVTEHRSQQVLWVHATNWTKPLQFAPDITTYLCQIVRHPYVEGAMPVEGEVEAAGPDPRSSAELAKEILGAEIEDGTAADPLILEKVLDATHALAGEAAMGIRRSDGSRTIQRFGSPVQSARFL